jgi:hypothetical protein
LRLSLDRQQSLVCVFNLQCRVIDVELLVQHGVERTPDRVTIGAAGHQHVCRENGVSGREFP